MRSPSWKSLLTSAFLALPTAHGLRQLQSTSLNQCDGSTSSGFTANLFNVVFTADNGTLSYNINAISSISQKVKAELNVAAYGLVIVNKTIDPCDEPDFSSLCPLNPGSIPINSNSQLPPSTVNQIPGIAFSVPDLDAKVGRSGSEGSRVQLIATRSASSFAIAIPMPRWPASRPS